MRTRRLLVMSLIACLVVLAGCVNATMKTTVNADGSGDVAITLEMQKQSFDQLKSMGGDPFEKAKADFKTAGYAVADSKSGTDSVGFSASKHLGDVTGKVIPDTITAAMKIAEQTTTTNAKPASGSLTKQAGLTSDTWTAAFVIPTSSGQGPTYKIQLVMPGKVTSSNAQEKLGGGKTLQWELEAGKDTPIKATATVDQTPRLIAIIVAALVGLAIVVFVILYSRRKREDKAAAAAGAEAPGAAAPATEPVPPAATEPPPPVSDAASEDAATVATSEPVAAEIGAATTPAPAEQAAADAPAEAPAPPTESADTPSQGSGGSSDA